MWDASVPHFSSLRQRLMVTAYHDQLNHSVHALMTQHSADEMLSFAPAATRWSPDLDSVGSASFLSTDWLDAIIS
jgi:hypothetical protein